jgi:hypothetical protein
VCSSDLFGEEALARHPVFFLYDVAAHLQTLTSLESIDAEWVVPSHGRPVRDAAALVAANRAALQRTADTILASCETPATFEEILAELCRVFSIELNTGQYVLVGGTLRAFLAWMSDLGSVAATFQGGRMTWKRQ